MIDSSLLALFHCPLKLGLPLRSVPISRPSQGHSCPCPPHSVLAPSGPPGAVLPEVPIAQTEETAPLAQGKIRNCVAKQPTLIQMPAAAWAEGPEERNVSTPGRASWDAPKTTGSNQGCSRREAKQMAHMPPPGSQPSLKVSTQPLGSRANPNAFRPQLYIYQLCTLSQVSEPL